VKVLNKVSFLFHYYVLMIVHGENYIPYARGEFPAQLGREKLVGKLYLSSDMTTEEVEMEIWSVFETPMGIDAFFPLKLLLVVVVIYPSLQFLPHSTGMPSSVNCGRLLPWLQ